MQKNLALCHLGVRVGLLQIDGTEGRTITRTIRGNPMNFTGVDYLQQFSIPNFYFHAATAYGILRHNGVAVGKLDFLGKLG